MEHKFDVRAEWRGGVNGGGKVEGGALRLEVSAPAAFGGPGKGTNPEEMILAAAATCYVNTLAAVLEKRKLLPERIDMTSGLTVLAEKGLRLTRIVHRPRIALPPGATDEQKQTVKDAVERAERACLVSNAIRNNVAVVLEPEIVGG